jgi:REP element-mobilizing transposase RayT
LSGVAVRHKIDIAEMSIMSDYTYVIEFILLTMSVSKALHLLKGEKTRDLCERKLNFRKRYPWGHFWRPSNFYKSVGDADLETVTRYVQVQRLVQMT